MCECTCRIALVCLCREWYKCPLHTLGTGSRLAPVSNVNFFSKTDNLSKIAIYKLYLEVEILRLDIRDWWVRVFTNQLTGRCWQGIYHFYYPDLFQAVSVLWNNNMCYLMPPAEIYDCTNLQVFSTCLGNFHAFGVCWFSQNIPFFKKVLSKIKSNSLDHDQAWSFVGPDLGSNCFPLFQQTALIDRMHTNLQIQKRSCCANITLYIPVSW